MDSKLWKCGEEYKVHVRCGLSNRLGKLLGENPSTYYYKKNKLVAVDFNLSYDKKEKVQKFIKKHRLKKKR
jgi:hypothetical protein